MGYLFKGVWCVNGHIEDVREFRLWASLRNIENDMHETYNNIQEYKKRGFLFRPKCQTINSLKREEKRMRTLRKMRRIIKDELKRRKEE